MEPSMKVNNWTKWGMDMVGKPSMMDRNTRATGKMINLTEKESL